jgi:hypothetical protein
MTQETAKEGCKIKEEDTENISSPILHIKITTGKSKNNKVPGEDSDSRHDKSIRTNRNVMRKIW